MAVDCDTASTALDIPALMAHLDALAGPKSGAVAHFIGRVRDTDDNLNSLTLEHFPGMTERALTDIAEQAVKRFDLTGALIRHRYGVLRAGQPIVFVGAASGHRQAAIDGINFMMDYLKTDAPFWKKETRDSGSQWIAARDSDELAKGKWR